MIELDTALIIVMAEALAVLVLLIGASLFIVSRRKRRERDAANALIVQWEEAENKRSKKLGELIREHCEIDKDKLRSILLEIRDCERSLCQQILQIFLKRDVVLLKEVDRAINKLSSPYCRILAEMTSMADSSLSEELEQAKANISRLKKEGKMLAEQLETALKTMDEMSTEYTRVFSGKQTELELENSSKKMLGIFRAAEKNVHSSSKELTDVGEG